MNSGIPFRAILFAILLSVLARTAFGIEVLEEAIEQKYAIDPEGSLSIQ
ncbi:MAG: hypothetical protein QOE34_759, partial [Verrucomicrobiota bacterium]